MRVVTLRSIPACAGEPTGTCITRRLMRVYPRVCGGTGGHATDQERVVRSIPACAGEPATATPGPGAMSGLSPRVRGNLSLSAPASLPLRVYPRVCGGTLEIRHCRHSLSLSRSVRIAEITRDLASITSRRSRSARFRHRGRTVAGYSPPSITVILAALIARSGSHVTIVQALAYRDNASNRIHHAYRPA